MDTDVALMVDAIREGLREDIRQMVLTEADHVLKDVEWRFKQALEREQSSTAPWMRRSVTAEDLDINKHVLTGYTVTNNSPVGGSIAWSSLHIVYNGVDNLITDANTALKYAYWQLSTPTVLTTSNTKPTLGKDDIMVFYNNAGTAVVAAADGNGSLPAVIANASVDNAALNGQVITNLNVTAGTITASNQGLASGAIYTNTLFTAGVVNTTALSPFAVTAPKMTTLQHVLY